MMRVVADIMEPMSNTSDAYEEAVRCRAVGVGLVPIGIIRMLTPAEWGCIRLMSQAEACKLVRTLDAEPVMVVERIREVDCER